MQSRFSIIGHDSHTLHQMRMQLNLRTNNMSDTQTAVNIHPSKQSQSFTAPLNTLSNSATTEQESILKHTSLHPVDNNPKSNYTSNGSSSTASISNKHKPTYNKKVRFTSKGFITLQ